MDRDPRGTISQQGNVMRIDNAFVEEVVPANRSSNGYLLVSYATAGANRTTSIQNLRLNITRNTVLLDSLGRQIRLSDIRKGMWVNVVFSSAMTRSIPPQSTAFLIVARRDFQTSSSTTTTGRVAMVDPVNEILYTGNPFDVNSQTKYLLSNATITDRSGRPISIRATGPDHTCKFPDFEYSTADNSFSCSTALTLLHILCKGCINNINKPCDIPCFSLS